MHAPFDDKTDTTLLPDNKKLGSSSSPYLLPLDEYPHTSTTATANTVTLVEKTQFGITGNTTPSPVLSSSSSSASSSSSVYSSNEEPQLIPEDYFYSHLQTHSSLLRIMLKRPVPCKVKTEHWYRLDLEVLDEFGMSIKGKRAKGSNMRLACELLERRDGQTRQCKEYEVVWRALRYDAWEWTDETLHMTLCSGFDKSSAGGLEFKLIHTAATGTTWKPLELYLRIVPTFESHQTIHALPLVVGPLSILCDDSSLMKHQQWKSASTCQTMHRTFKLDNMEYYFMIKEGWDLGTPGKMWDSALVISDLFIQRIIQQPSCLENCHLLDLSAGTGTAGLLISFMYQYILPKHHHHNIKITLTDLPEALPLIHHNGQINGINTNNSQLSVTPLSWGRAKDIQHIKNTLPPIDIIIASDVLYEPCNFAILVKTLARLAEPGRTVIYLGYKRRGLKEPDEQCFFRMCQDDFEIQAIGADERNDMVVVDWERRMGKLTKRTDHMDGQGWLGPYTNDMARQSFKQTGVQIYRLVRKAS